MVPDLGLYESVKKMEKSLNVSISAGNLKLKWSMKSSKQITYFCHTSIWSTNKDRLFLLPLTRILPGEDKGVLQVITKAPFIFQAIFWPKALS